MRNRAFYLAPWPRLWFCGSFLLFRIDGIRAFLFSQKETRFTSFKRPPREKETPLFYGMKTMGSGLSTINKENILWPVLLILGSFAAALSIAEASYRAYAFIQKPFSPQSLVYKVRETLDH